MLAKELKPGNLLQIGRNIVIKVIRLRHGAVRLGVEAPQTQDIQVVEEEEKEDLSENET